MQMHMPDYCPRWHSRPGLSGTSLVLRRREEARDVEGHRRHHELPVMMLPGGPRPIGIDLDTQAVGIRQIDRLAHEVVGHPRVRAELLEVSEEPPERRPVR